MAPKTRPTRTIRSLLATALTAAAIAAPTLATSTAAATPTPFNSAAPSCAPALITDALTATTSVLNPNQDPTDASRPTSMVDLATKASSASTSASQRLTRLTLIHGTDTIAAAILDPTAHVDACDRLFYAEPATGNTNSQPNTAPTATERADTISAARATGMPEVFDPLDLSSRPNAPVTLYLDFDGADVTGTGWNNQTGHEHLIAAPYNPDNQPGEWSTYDKAAIWTIWETVSDRFSMFDINVTTRVPAASDIAATDENDTRYGTVAIITDTVELSHDLCGGCGGVAYLDIFRTDYRPIHHQLLPAWVFAGQVRPIDIGGITSHEIGHNFGLSHMGLDEDAYFGFSSNPDKQPDYTWRPTMGAGIPIGQWSNGNYDGATNTENQIDLMRRWADRRPDDHPTTGPLFPNTPLTGTIHTASDTDTFLITAPAGISPQVHATVVSGSGLNAKVTVTTLDGTVVNKATITAPASGTTGPRSVTVTIPATNRNTDYLVTIDGVGTNTRYGQRDDYGSLGNYILELIQPDVPTITATQARLRTITTGTHSTTWFADATDGTTSNGTTVSGNYEWTFPDGLPGTLGAYPGGDRRSELHLTGTVNTSGTYPIRVTVSSPNNETTTRTINLTVADENTTNPDPLAFTTEIGKATTKKGKKTRIVMRVTGGTMPYTWAHTGTLPKGMKIKPTTTNAAKTLLTGKPKKKGKYRLIIKVSDTNGDTITQKVRLIVR